MGFREKCHLINWVRLILQLIQLFFPIPHNDKENAEPYDRDLDSITIYLDDDNEYEWTCELRIIIINYQRFRLPAKQPVGRAPLNFNNSFFFYYTFCSILIHPRKPLRFRGLSFFFFSSLPDYFLVFPFPFFCLNAHSFLPG